MLRAINKAVRRIPFTSHYAAIRAHTHTKIRFFAIFSETVYDSDFKTMLYTLNLLVPVQLLWILISESHLEAMI